LHLYAYLFAGEKMTREDIIRMAREAGLAHFYDSEGHCTGITDERLITESKERNDDRLVEILTPFAALVASAEREACAELCEMLDVANPKGKSWDEGTIDCANAIRARGQA